MLVSMRPPRVFSGLSALVISLTLIAACTRVESPAASTTTPAPLAQPEAEAWATVRAAHPAVPIIVPTWLPASVERGRVEVRGIGFGPSGAASDPRYTVAYVAPSGAAIIIGLGPESDIGSSKIGTRVRNSPAILSFGTMESSGPWKRIRWRENGYDLRVETDRFSGDDLLHVAWSLDRAGAPAPKNLYTRVKPGVCAARGAAPEETVRRLLALVGAGDRDAVLDCFSLELIGDLPGYGEWSNLPRASDIRLQPSSELGGRIVVGASWSFASDPGGAWGRQGFQIFVLGVEDGSWRVYETATATYAPPP
jgi:hypothetical protein